MRVRPDWPEFIINVSGKKPDCPTCKKVLFTDNEISVHWAIGHFDVEKPPDLGVSVSETVRTVDRHGGH